MPSLTLSGSENIKNWKLSLTHFPLKYYPLSLFIVIFFTAFSHFWQDYAALWSRMYATLSWNSLQRCICGLLFSSLNFLLRKTGLQPDDIEIRLLVPAIIWFLEEWKTVTELEKAITHKSANTHADNVFVTRDLDLWPFEFKINGFPGLMMKHFCVKFSDPSCIGFWDIVRKIRQTQNGICVSHACNSLYSEHF